MGYLVPGHDGPGLLPDLDSCWDAAVVAVAAVTWKFRLTFGSGNYFSEFSNWILTHMGDVWALRPGFYTEFRAK